MYPKGVPRLAALAYAVLVAVLAGGPAPVSAAEYRLLTANIYDSAFFSYLDGPIGRGEGEASLDRLARSLDTGVVPAAVLLADRDVQPAPEGVATAFGAVTVRAGAHRGADDRGQWVGVRWDGSPGERTIWVIGATRFSAPVARDLALERTGDGLRHFIPYSVAISARPGVAVRYPLEFVRGFEGRRALWDRYLSRTLDLRGGLAAVVGANPNPQYADYVYLVIDHLPAAVTFKVVVAWGDRAEFGAPGTPAATSISPAR